MKNKINNYTVSALILGIVLVFSASCTRDFDDLELASYPKDPNVFIDGFSAGLQYAAFGGSKVTAFDVDTEVKFEGAASMKIEVPDFEDPAGAYAGGVYFTEIGRDLSDYDALTMWVKASQPATIDLIGFGNDLAELKYVASISNLPVNTNWKKVIIPIPDPSKLTAERGMLFYSEGPEDGLGYTFWIDEVKFEKLGTIAHPRHSILEQQEQTISAETGDKLSIGGTYSIFNMPDGTDQRIEVAPGYFNFSITDSTVASIDDHGVVTVLNSGSAFISARLGGSLAIGRMIILAIDALPAPQTPAPVPTQDEADVISLFSNAYTNVPVDVWNTYWENSTTLIIEGIQVQGDDIKRYKYLNFVGIEFSSQQIDASDMTHFHMDIWTSDPTSLPAAFKVLLADFGADGNYGGGDDASHEVSFTSPVLKTEEWVSLDIPLTEFAGLINRKNLAQMVLSGDLTNVYIDNVYFYDDGSGGGPTGPTEAAPSPSHSSSDVISVFSDTYTNLTGTDFYPDWGQSTTVAEVMVNGNNTLLYAGLNYQGIELESSLDGSEMTHLHLDYWSTNSNNLNVYLISSGPVEEAYALSVPTSGWNSVDIPLTEFTTIDLADIIQFKFDGNGTIYLDNIYLHK